MGYRQLSSDSGEDKGHSMIFLLPMVDITSTEQLARSRGRRIQFAPGLQF